MINDLRRKEKKGGFGVIALLLVISLMFMLTACGGGEPTLEGGPDEDVTPVAEGEDAFVAYINSDGYKKMKELHMKFDESYNSVNYENYVDGPTLVNEYVQTTTKITEELVKVAGEVDAQITDQTIKGMHSNYMIFADKLNQSINRMLTAVDMNDEAMKTEADALMEDSNDAYYDYLVQMNEMANERGITLEY